ncbi:MAG: PhzF family phenazine biosynthesis protein [Sphingomonas sp.]|uniref:PhzF family phenazine biosynthesis protein n=1 Tax=Sphingomonas sp. TaxID=28214 RepID=UPI001793FB9E|nr:PhzF family phenazine biosynthesis protein [Sphingomonas sp.]MBA3666647.1 PhzF family phenazine biosynthesis protein [Sphingomonas sp.]
MDYAFETVDVFTERRFGGNPLAVFVDARGLSDSQMQSLAAEMNLSETTFVLPPTQPGNTARLRIFNRTAEMAFAGHPCIGTAYVLARRATAKHSSMRFEVPAGVVHIEIERVADAVVGALLTAPQPLWKGAEYSPEEIAICVGIASGDVLVHDHPPLAVAMGNPYVVACVTPTALGQCVPDQRAFRDFRARHPELGDRFSLHLYVRNGSNLYARMFAPLAGTIEDPATGSANAPLAGLLLSLGAEDRLELTVRQGVEMGRPSLLRVTATRTGDGIKATVAGRCVPVLAGAASLELE